ncbi:eukaryotic translation initiation factor 1A, isoform CRA_a [Mus musculus]|uniref:Eukaryotic translation initiation factor 1A n=2 Tax=Mus musculus TaxID=10090 RepID=A0A494BB48_MOUSE|nr:eukaryotic translation initiation factor 1A, isoform CRA_a [Mus musculus]
MRIITRFSVGKRQLGESGWHVVSTRLRRRPHLPENQARTEVLFCSSQKPGLCNTVCCLWIFYIHSVPVASDLPLLDTSATHPKSIVVLGKESQLLSAGVPHSTPVVALSIMPKNKGKGGKNRRRGRISVSLWAVAVFSSVSHLFPVILPEHRIPISTFAPANRSTLRPPGGTHGDRRTAVSGASSLLPSSGFH